MKTYNVLGQNELIAMAAARGWVEGSTERHRTVQQLPSVLFCPRDRAWSQLPATEVVFESSLCLRIPSAVIHGGNFSLIIEDQIYPGGFAHSFAPSPAWRAVEGGRVAYEVRELQRLKGAGIPNLLGLVAHWGHFFVDALERLLLLEQHGQLQSGPLLVSDPNFFGLSPGVDELGAVPQVSDLMRAMGIDVDPAQVVALDKKLDFVVEDLRIHTLGALKPAIPAAAFQTVRQRALGGASLPEGPWSDDDDARLLFVGRADVRKRFMLNQDELVRFIADHHGGETVYPEHLSLRQSLQHFNAASRVILPIGSAKFNLLFCRPGTRVVCVSPKGYSERSGGVNTMVRHLCHALDLKLAFYDVDIVEQSMLINSDMRMTEADIEEIVDVFDEMT